MSPTFNYKIADIANLGKSIKFSRTVLPESSNNDTVVTTINFDPILGLLGCRVFIKLADLVIA